MKDLTSGKPAKVILLFSMPLLLSMALQQIYNIADSVIVGRFAGGDGLAAIGAAYPITLIFIAVATGASMGISVIVGQIFGAKELTKLKTAVSTAILSMLVLGTVMSAVGVLGARAILTALGTENVLEDATAYLAIYSVGVIANFVYNTVTAIYTGLGDSKRPLYFLLISSVLNIILDYLAVAVWNYGVAGAAWATTISQFVAAVLSAVVLTARIRGMHAEGKAPLFSGEQLKQMCRISVPSMVQQCCVAFSHTIIQRVVNSFGTDVMAGYEASSKIHNFVYMCMNTLGTAFSSFSAQNFGAGRRERIREGYRWACVMCIAFSVLVTVLLQATPSSLVGMFVEAEENKGVIEVGVKYLRTISPDYLLISVIIISGGLLRGIGRIRSFLFVTLLDFAVRIAMSYLLCLPQFVGMGYTGLFWAWYFGSALDLVICLIWYRTMCRSGELAENIETPSL